MVPNAIRHLRGKPLTDKSGTPGSSDVYSNGLVRNPARHRQNSMLALQDSTEGLYTNIELGDRVAPTDEAKEFSVRVQTDIQMQWEETRPRTRAGSV